MATTQKIRNDIAKTKEKIAEQQKRLRALEAQLAEEENLEIVRMVKAVKMDNKELTAFLKAYASGMISLPLFLSPPLPAAARKPRSPWLNRKRPGMFLICFPLWRAARSRYPSPRTVSSSVPVKMTPGRPVLSPRAAAI